MLCFPNAKINIGLNVIKKRKDGFHDIESIFYPVNYSDAIEFIPANKFSFKNEGIIIPSKPSGNLCIKAYKLIKEEYQIPDIELILLKNIPIGSGLGGGSSDATFTLMQLNKLFNLDISEEQLFSYANALGSDCSFFLKNKPLYVTGTGDQFQDIKLDMKGYQIIIITPHIQISTKEAYSNINPEKPQEILRDLIRQPVKNWKTLIFNDFENFVFHKHPEIKNIKDTLYDSGATYASLSGSGSSVYGIFENKVNLEKETYKDCRIWSGTLE